MHSSFKLHIPRFSSDNFEPNDRRFHYPINLNVTKFADLQVSDMRMQYVIIHSATEVYLDHGSSFYINAMFCENCKINVFASSKENLDYDIRTYPAWKAIVKMIKEKNNEIVIIEIPVTVCK